MGCKTTKQKSDQGNKILKTFSAAYQSLKSINGGTLKYMQVNFVYNKSSYIRQPLSKPTAVSEIPFKKYIPGDNANDVNAVPNLSLYMYSFLEADQRIANKKNPNVIVIYLEKPSPMNMVVKLIRM